MRLKGRKSYWERIDPIPTNPHPPKGWGFFSAQSPGAKRCKMKKVEFSSYTFTPPPTPGAVLGKRKPPLPCKGVGVILRES